MKNKLLLIAAAILVLFSFQSCRKEFSISPVPVTDTSNPSNPSTPSGTVKGLLVSIGQGTDPDESQDTMHVIKYDSLNRPIYIIDKYSGDSISGIYNLSGQLESVRQGSNWLNGYIDYTYNSSGQLSEMNASSGDHYSFEYDNGILSKSTLSMGSGAGTPVLPRLQYVYTFTSGNLTNIKELGMDGGVRSESRLTYGNQPNIFKTLLLFNIQNYLGFNSIVEFIMSFNTNMPATNNIYSNGTLASTQTYTYVNNSSNKLVSLKNVFQNLPSYLDPGPIEPMTFSMFFNYQ